ncbi:MAG: hypothetical protein ACLTZT_10685 [Butyricimonas faecalis]
MKNSYLTMIIFTIFIIGFCTNTRAQKQGRVERLYQHITWSEGDKYDRLRERMDTKSMDAYKNEISLADALRQLLLTPRVNAIEPYRKVVWPSSNRTGAPDYAHSAKQQT